MSISKLFLIILVVGFLTVSVAQAIDVTYTEYDPFNFTVRAGLYDRGNLTDLIYLDGNFIRVNETLGANPLDVRLNWTNIPSDIISLSLRIYDLYEGNPAHVVQHQAWNFSSNSWIVLKTKGEDSYEWDNSSLSINTGDYLGPNGEFWYRYYHVSNGAVGHYAEGDYIKLTGYITASESNLNPWDVSWLMGIIWLVILSLGYMKDSKILILFAGMFGLVLGFLLMGINSMVSICIIIIGLYLIYEGTGTNS